MQFYNVWVFENGIWELDDVEADEPDTFDKDIFVVVEGEHGKCPTEEQKEKAILLYQDKVRSWEEEKQNALNKYKSKLQSLKGGIIEDVFYLFNDNEEECYLQIRTTSGELTIVSAPGRIG